MNIFLNYIPNKLITDDDKDPAWMNEYIKRKTLHIKIMMSTRNYRLYQLNCQK